MKMNLVIIKTLSKTIFFTMLFFSVASCGNKKEKTDTNPSINDEKPLHPEIKTDFGELPGGYKTMDEYYLDGNNNKVWHGRRLNIYPSGRNRMEAFYEHGVEKGYIKYDEAGNVLEDTRK